MTNEIEPKLDPLGISNNLFQRSLEGDPKTKDYIITKIQTKLEKDFYSLHVNKMTDNSVFQKNIQPLFSGKKKFEQKIDLEDSKKNIISDDALM